MNIIDIAIAKQLAGGGGGSGTDSYNDLSNLPKINDVTLSGNKSSSALGLQSEITSDSKLASDLVDDTNQDNKFVTSAEKTTWNGKQNAIDNSHKLSSDLVDDANHTNKFVTSTEKQTWNAKQNAIDADHKLSSSLVSFSEAEAAAIASGIDSSKVGQISTNQTNILYALQKVGTNIANVPEEQTVRSITFTRNSDGWITSSASSDTAAWTVANANIEIQLEAKNYTIVWEISSDSDDTVELALFTPSGTQLFSMSATTSNRKVTRAFTISSGDVGTFHIMYKTRTQKARLLVVETSVYNAYSEYQLYGAPNYDLTRLEAEDRAALVELVDSGAKNLFSDNNVSDVVGVTWNSSTGTATQSSTDTQSNLRLKLQCRNGSSGTFTELFNNQVITSNGVVSFEFTCPTAATQLRFGHNGSQADATMILTGFNLQANTKYYIQCNVINCVQASGAYSWNKIMVCTKAAFGVSQKFVPYQWVCLGNRMTTGSYPSGTFDENSSIIVYHNARLNRCIAVYDLNVASPITAGTVYALLQLVSGEDFAIPKGDVYEYYTADDDSFHIRIGKNSENRVGAFRVLSGTVPNGTNIKMQLEWTYI